MKTSLGKLVVVLLLLLVSSTCYAQQTLTVPDDYPTIQAAIDAAQAGDIVYVRAGRYTENIVIDKPLSLIGEDQTKVIIRSPGSENDIITVKLDAGDVSIVGITVTAGNTGVYILVGARAKVILARLTTIENQVGITALGEGNLTLKQSFLIDSQIYGLVLGASTAIIKWNEFLFGGIGICLVGKVDAEIANNLIGFCRWGINTYTIDCGYREGEELFPGKIGGKGNSVRGVNADFCPSYPSDTWPNGFIDLAWRKKIDDAIVYFKHGEQAYNAQYFQEAQEAYEAGLAIFVETPFPLWEACFKHNIGNIYYKTGQYKDALASYQSAREIYVPRGMDVDVADVDKNIGIVYAELGRYEEALASYQSARSLYIDHQMEANVAGIDKNIGVVYSDLGRYEEALAAYRSARAVFVEQNMGIDTADIDCNIGNVDYQRGRYEEALASYASAREVFVIHAIDVKVASVDTGIGLVYIDLGYYEEALALHQAARAVFEEHKMDVNVAGSDRNIGNVYAELGRYEEALASYQSARAVFEARNMDIDAARADQNIGNVYRDLGHYEEALALYQTARAVLASCQMEVDVAKLDMNTGNVYAELGRYEEALAVHKSARAVFVEKEMEVHVADANVNISNVYAELGRYEEALASYAFAREVFAVHAIDVKVASVDMGIGLIYTELGRYEEALASYASAREVFMVRAMDLNVAEIDANVGNLYDDLGFYKEALVSYQSALEVFLAYEMDVKVAGTDQNVGAVYTNLGRYEEALAAYQSARAVYVDRGMEVNVAKIDQNIGGVYSDLSRYEDALAKYEQARAVLLAHGMEVDVAVIDQNIGGVYSDLGQYEEALAAYQSARVVFLSHALDVKVGIVDQNIGTVHWKLGRYEEALASYQSVRVVYVAHKMEVDVAGIDQNSGNVYGELGQYEDALVKYQSARVVYVACKLDVKVAGIDKNIGNVYGELGRYLEALTAYASSRKVYLEHGMGVEIAGVDWNIGIVHWKLRLYEKALSAYQSARKVHLEHGMNVQAAGVDTSIGNVYWSLGRYEDALSSYNDALEILDKIPPAAGMTYSYPTTRWMVLNNKGLCYEKQGQWDEAVAAYQDSIAVIESLRGYMKSEELKTAWQERTQDVYEQLIKLLIDQGQGASAFTYAERCRARTFLDALYQGSIAPDQLISPEAGVSSGAVDPKAIDQAVADARDSLQGNEAVLEYMVTDSGVYLWVITKERISDPIFIEYEREQLMNDVITLRETLESDTPDPITLTGLLTSFYDKLVKESLAKLPDGVDTLILIPSGPLWYLPFSALVMTDQELPTGPGTTRHPYLVERYTLAYLPSLASLSSLTKGETEAAGGVRLLALADPELSPDQLRASEGSKCGEEQSLDRYEQLVVACQDFADLLVGEEQEEQCVYAGREAQEVRAHVETGRQVVVYAAHGQFNPYVPLQSKLLLASGGEAANPQTDSRVLDGNYHAWEVLLTDYRGTKLVILAVCESLLPALRQMQGTLAVLANQECDQVELTPQQLEKIVVGDEVVGLARAFLSSGAEAVLGTLWLANPYAIESLLTLMADYHKNEGATWAQALTKAQRELITNDAFKSPWLWAPYQLIGRWR